MGMHTNEWLKDEINQLNTYHISLDKKKYKLDFIKVQFGEEYVPVPQDNRLIAVITKLGHHSLEEGLKLGVFAELIKMVGIKVNEDGYVMTEPEDEPKLTKAMEKLIYEKGPYYIIEKAYDNGYEWEMEYFICDGEEPYYGPITEEE